MATSLYCHGLFYLARRYPAAPRLRPGDTRRRKTQEAARRKVIKGLQKKDNAAPGTRYFARTIQTQGARRKKHSPQDSNRGTRDSFSSLFRAIQGFDRHQIKIHRPSRGVKLRKNSYRQLENTHNSMQFEQDEGQFD